MKSKDQSILKATVCFLAIGIIMSFKLWINDRVFPLIPIADFLNIPIVFAYALIGILFTLIFLLLIFPKRTLVISLFGLLIFLAIQDQMRWQPWFYHYLIFLIPFCFKRKGINMGYFQLIMIGIYFWGGVNKLNSNFIDQIFPHFIHQITNWEIIHFKEISYIVPFTEIFIAFGLLFKTTRKWAVYAAYTTHVFILIYLSPLGSNSNSIIIPWNIAMITFLFLCFNKANYNTLSKRIWEGIHTRVELFIILLFLSLPIMSFWRKWDYYLSFNLYSGKNEIFFIAIEESQMDKLTFDLTKAFVQIEGLEGGELIDINRWSVNELNVPIPPEKRIFKTIANQFCKLNIPNEKIMFLEVEQPISKGNLRSYSCEELK